MHVDISDISVKWVIQGLSVVPILVVLQEVKMGVVTVFQKWISQTSPSRSSKQVGFF